MSHKHEKMYNHLSGQKAENLKEIVREHNCQVTYLHLTSSVGQRVKEEKKAAKPPDTAFWWRS